MNNLTQFHKWSFVVLLVIPLFSFAQVEIEQLYLSEPGQGLDRVDPVLNHDGNTAQSELIGYFPGGTVNVVNSISGFAGTTSSSVFTLSNVQVLPSNDRLMLVGISTKDGKVTSVKYNDVLLNLVGYLDGTIMSTQAPILLGSNSAEVYIYSFLNPPVGTANIEVTLDSDYKKGIIVGATNFSGVNQSNPFGEFVSASYHDATESPFDLNVPAITGTLIFDVSSVRNGVQTMAAGQTQLYNINSGSEINGGSSLKNATSPSTLLSWSSTSCQEVGRAGVSINPGIKTSTSFIQSSALCNTLIIKGGAPITITNYLNISEGSMPANPSLTVELTYDSTNIISLSNPTYNAATNLLTWSGSMGSDVAVPAGQSIVLTVTTAEPNVAFYIDYDSETKPSKIEFSRNSGANVFPPSLPSTISGHVSPSLGSSQTYSVVNEPGLTYNWVLPIGWTQTSGGNSNAITVDVGSLSGNISVTPNNGVCNGETRVLNLFTAKKQLYLSEPSQALDRIDPVATSDITTSTSPVLTIGSSVTLDLIAIKDTGIKLKNELDNYGSCSSIIIDRETTDSQRMLVHFDLSSIPPGAVIESAELRLNCTSGADMDVSVFKIGDSDIWDEGVQCGANGFSSWNQRNSSSNWSALGAIGPNSNSGTPLSTINVSTAGIQAWPITCLVEDWVSGSSVNNGLALSVYQADGEMGNRTATYDSRETTTGIKPTLHVTYSTNSISFEQTPSFCSPFTIKRGNPITITNYISVVSGTMPVNPDITAILKTSCSNIIITLTEPSYDETSNLLTWSGSIGADNTIPAGEAIILVVGSNESGVTFSIDYDSQSKPSKVEFATSTFIEVSNFKAYDAPFPTGNLITTAEGGTLVYLRAEVSDPFGSYDITELVIDNQGVPEIPSIVSTTSCSKTYEYELFTPGVLDTYTYNALAKEGYENAVTDSENLNLTITTAKIDFDGINDHIDFGDAHDVTSSFSFEAWVLQETTVASGTIISKGNSKSGNKTGYNLSIINNFPNITWYDAAGAVVVNLTSDYPIANNKWYHVAATFDGSITKIYIDGLKVAETLGSVAPVDVAEKCIVGAVYDSDTPNSPKNYFNGFIDEIRIWSTGLTEQQIREMMNQEIESSGALIKGKTIPLNISGELTWASLEGYYPLNDNVADSKSINYHYGIKRNINSIEEQTAPLPYYSIDLDSPSFINWDVSSTWMNGEVCNLPNSMGVDGVTKIDWNITETYDNIYVPRDLSLLGLKNNAETLVIEEDHYLNVSSYLKLDGKIDLEGDSQLLQGINSILDVESAGVLEKDQQGTKDLYTYNYWSSPVGNSDISANNNNSSLPDVLMDGSNPDSPIPITYLSSGHDGAVGPPIMIADYWIWKYANLPSNDMSAWQHIRSSGMINAGEGFTMKGVADTNNNILLEQNYVFRGKPNNGDILLPLNSGYEYLVGNPYPSAIDADEFILDNIDVNDGGRNNSGNVINGALYFWDHFASGTHNIAEYEGGYAVYTLMGGTAAISSDARINATGGIGTEIPERYIPVGQGFFVSSVLDSNLVGLSQPVVGGDIVFKNSQRLFKPEHFTGANSGSVFIRSNLYTQSNNVGANDIRQKIRVTFQSPNGYHRQLLVGVDLNATDNFDLGYEAILIDENVEDFYWKINSSKFIIQAVNDFDETRVLPLGVKIDQSGMAIFRLQELNNIEEGLQIFIHDLNSNLYHDLRMGDFSIHLEPGEYQNRFEMTFAIHPTLGTEGLLEENSHIQIYYSNSKKSIIVYNPNFENSRSIEMFDMLGHSIFKSKAIMHKDILEYKADKLSTGSYIIKVETTQGAITQKVIVL